MSIIVPEAALGRYDDRVARFVASLQRQARFSENDRRIAARIQRALAEGRARFESVERPIEEEVTELPKARVPRYLASPDLMVLDRARDTTATGADYVLRWFVAAWGLWLCDFGLISEQLEPVVRQIPVEVLWLVGSALWVRNRSGQDVSSHLRTILLQLESDGIVPRAVFEKGVSSKDEFTRVASEEALRVLDLEARQGR